MPCFPTGPITTAAVSPSLRELYPVGKPIETGNLKVSGVHMIHYQVYGNPQGQPALVVHGGPGAGCYANHAYVLAFWQMHAIVFASHTSHGLAMFGDSSPDGTPLCDTHSASPHVLAGG